MITFLSNDQSCPSQPLPNLWHTGKNDDLLFHKYDVTKEKFLCLELLFIIFVQTYMSKTFTKMFLQFLQFLFTRKDLN